MRIGILGGGQLGWMLALAGYPLGLQFRFLDPAPDAPAGQVGEHWAMDYADTDRLLKFAEGLDLITYEFENVPVTAVQTLAQTVRVYPPSTALEVAQDRLSEKTLFQQLGIPTPAFAPVMTHAEFDQALQRIGLPAMLKTRRLGYDGKGQMVLRTAADIEAAWAQLGGVPLILESFVPFERELSILAVRGLEGALVFYPLVENHHREGILRLSLAPAPHLTVSLQTQAEDYARRVLTELNYIGVLAIEWFVQNGQLLANEMAPRVHNSGHWTIEGAATSQFENHLRAGLGWPLGSPQPRGHAAMINLIGVEATPPLVMQVAGAHLHHYGKTPRPGRKIGHITVVADDESTLQKRLAELEETFRVLKTLKV